MAGAIIEIKTKCHENRGGVISRSNMVGDWEHFTVELVCEPNLEAGRSLPLKGERYSGKTTHVKE